MRTASLALAAALAASPPWAQEQPGNPPSLLEEPATRGGHGGAVVSAGSEGFSLQSEGGDFRLQLRGYIQFDGRFFTGDEDALAVDAFLIRRARPIVQGALGRYFEFNITPDFGGGTATVQDAWLDFRPSSRLRVRVGRFKSPVGLERLQSATATHFVERALPTVVLPNRDVGIEVYGDLAGGVVSYAVAVLDGAPDGGSVDGDVNDGKDLAGRLFVSPFRKGTSSLKGLGLGLAGTTGQQTGPLPSYRSGGQISVLSLVAGVTADGPRNRLSPQLSFYSGPFGVLAEYARSSSRVKTADGTRLEFVAGAWQATAVVAITGDDVSYEGVRPRRPFDPSKGHWGALELAARIHRFQLEKDGLSAELVDPTRSARRISAWGLGLTWSLTRNVKQMADFDHASFEGGAAAGDRRSENVVFVRTQVSF